MTKEKIFAALMAGIMVFTMPVGVCAKQPDSDIVTPLWDYMNSVSVDITFSGTTGTASVEVTRIYQVTTKLEGTVTVYKQVGDRWVYVASNTGSSTRALFVEVEFDGVSGATYKAVADITAYGSSGSESDSASKTKTCP